ncbi:NB-ARC domain-containing protein, partial [Chloroflexota bacterium]
FGVDDKLAELTTALSAAGSPWLVSVVGIGGIGKTSLADAAIRVLLASPTFADICWVSARQERFTLWEGLQASPQGAPALTVAALLDGIIDQLGFQDLRGYPEDQKQGILRTRFKAQPYLVVVDNLETTADYRALVPDLLSLVNPSRFLLTSRHSMHEYPGIHNLSLDELSAADSLALLRHEAGERGLAEVATSSDEALMRVYEVTGGNPLAAKLLVGQMHTLSLPRVVDDLRQARGRRVEELYHFIYWRSWQLLSEEARRVLAIMPLVADSGGGLAQIAALSKLDEGALTAALGQLVTLCLVNVQGTVEARRYGIHRLTESFLLNEVLKWQAPQ